MASVRRRIEQGGERLWRLEDFRDHSFTAAAQALSRLKREGAIERLSKGVYYRPRSTPFGKSRPSPAAIQRLASARKRISRPASRRRTCWDFQRRRRAAMNWRRRR